MTSITVTEMAAVVLKCSALEAGAVAHLQLRAPEVEPRLADQHEAEGGQEGGEQVVLEPPPQHHLHLPPSHRLLHPPRHHRELEGFKVTQKSLC